MQPTENPHSPSAAGVLPLRERKKQRTRRELTRSAAALFAEHGFEAVTLDQLVDAAEVSKRTFFRFFPSKEAVAMAAEAELWEAYGERVAEGELRGRALEYLCEMLAETVVSLGGDWDRRFLACRALASRSRALRDYSDLASFAAQRLLVEVLERRLGVDSRQDVRLRLAAELAMAAWRCAARTWVRGARHNERSGHGPGELAAEIRRACRALPGAVELPATPPG
jgi:AcrR family transcriptional regulator